MLLEKSEEGCYVWVRNISAAVGTGATYAFTDAAKSNCEIHLSLEGHCEDSEALKSPVSFQNKV